MAVSTYYFCGKRIRWLAVGVVPYDAVRTLTTTDAVFCPFSMFDFLKLSCSVYGEM